MEAACESLRSQHIYRCWGEVRMGKSPNSSLQSHIRAGVKPTGIMTERDGDPFQIILLNPFENIRKPKLEYEYWNAKSNLDEFRALTGLYKDFEYQGSNSPLIPDFDKSRLSDEALLKEQIEKALSCKINGRLYIAKNPADCIEIRFLADREVLPTGPLVAFEQKVPGKDLWKIEDPGYCQVGLHNPMLSFSELLERAKDVCGY